MWVTRLQPDAITLPIPLLNMFQCGDDPINMFTEQAAEQVRLRQANGVDECHFYTLNRSDMTYAIAPILGVRAG
jgi:5,10-methylenetetrahydrofolate reductase